MSTLFSRASRRKNAKDEVGDVSITVILLDPVKHFHKKGNATRSFVVENTKVSIVAAALETLLGRSPTQ